MVVRAYGQSVGLYRLNTPFQLRGILIFSTKSDCQGPFDWSGSRQNWPAYLPIPKSLSQEFSEVGLVTATLDDCAVFIEAVLSDSQSLAPPFGFDRNTQTLSIQMKTTTTPVVQTIDFTAVVDDGVVARHTEVYSLTFNIVNAINSLAFASTTLSLQTKQTAQSTTI